MNLAIISLALTIVILIFVNVCDCDTSNLNTSGFRKLNERLSKIKHGKPADYLGAAKKELQRFSIDTLFSCFRSSKYGRALRSFIKLERVLKNTTCDIYEYHILKDLADSTIGHQYLAQSIVRKIPPVDRTVHEISKTRARKCLPILTEQFKVALAKISPELREKAEFKRHKSLFHRHKMNDIQYMSWIIDFTFTDCIFTLEEAIDHINSYSKHDPEACYFDKMTKKYLQDPCREYAKELYPIGIQLLFDARMFEDKEGFDFGDLSISEGNDMVPFYQALAHARACHKVDTEEFADTLYNYWYHVQQRENSECYKELQALVAANEAQSPKSS